MIAEARGDRMEDARLEARAFGHQLDLRLMKAQKRSRNRMLALVKGLFGAEEQPSEKTLAGGGLGGQPLPLFCRADQRLQVGLQVFRRFDVHPDRFVGAGATDDDDAKALSVGNGAHRAGRPAGAPVGVGGHGLRRKTEFGQQLAGKAPAGSELVDPLRDGFGHGRGLFREKVFAAFCLEDRRAGHPNVGSQRGRQPGRHRGEFFVCRRSHRSVPPTRTTIVTIVGTPVKPPGVAPRARLGQRQGMLLDEERRLIDLCAAAIGGKWETVRQIRAQAGPGEPNRAWRETILQLHLFAGFPRQVETYGVLQAAGGLGELDPDEQTPATEDRTRGLELFTAVYGSQAERVQDALRAGHPEIERWILGHAYGRVLTRPGLSPRMRELLAVAALSILDQKRQLFSHVRGALRCGATLDEIRQTIEQIDAELAPVTRAAIDEIVNQFEAEPSADAQEAP